jgi:hypothetical protein
MEREGPNMHHYTLSSGYVNSEADAEINVCERCARTKMAPPNGVTVRAYYAPNDGPFTCEYCGRVEPGATQEELDTYYA